MGKTSPVVQGNPYPKIKIPRIWSTIFWGDISSGAKTNENINERHRQSKVGGGRCSQSFQVGGSCPTAPPPPRFPRPWPRRPETCIESQVSVAGERRWPGRQTPYNSNCSNYQVCKRLHLKLSGVFWDDIRMFLTNFQRYLFIPIFCIPSRRQVNKNCWPLKTFFYKFSSNVCLGGFAGSEPSLSIACCAGPDPTTRSRNSSAMAEFYPNV